VRPHLGQGFSANEYLRYFWGYYEPIRLFMPKNCSADVQATIAHIDQVLQHGTIAEQQKIKDNFGFGQMKWNDDVAGTLRNNLWDWELLAVRQITADIFESFSWCMTVSPDY
jgi:hypothetical protein